jgi:hypothetical protein
MFARMACCIATAARARLTPSGFRFAPLNPITQASADNLPLRRAHSKSSQPRFFLPYLRSMMRPASPGPLRWHNPHECHDFGRLYGETRKSQTGCWSGLDLNLRAPSSRPLVMVSRVSLPRRFRHGRRLTKSSLSEEYRRIMACSKLPPHHRRAAGVTGLHVRYQKVRPVHCQSDFQ